MITIISGTNRPNSNTSKVAKFYKTLLEAKQIEHQYFSLEDLPEDLFTPAMYGYNEHAGLNIIQESILKPTTKFILVFPEYNGSFPGILKAFIDASDIAGCWHNKKACMVGVAAGRAGNLRGMEHMTNILNHLRINVLHLKIPVSGVSQLIDKEGSFNSPETKVLLEQQLALFEAF